VGGRLAPAVEQLGLPLGAALREHGLDEGEQLRRLRVRLDGDPARQRLLHRLGQVGGELGPALLGRRDHDVDRAAGRANAPVELLRHRAEVVGGELVDVALEARLRQSALVVACRLVVGEVGHRLETPVVEP
jgi:hypothetical protein